MLVRDVSVCCLIVYLFAQRMSMAVAFVSVWGACVLWSVLVFAATSLEASSPCIHMVGSAALLL